MGNAEVVGSNGNLVGSNQGNLGGNSNLGNPGSLGNLLGSSEGTESRQNYWAPSFGNWPTHTVSKLSPVFTVLFFTQSVSCHQFAPFHFLRQPVPQCHSRCY